MWTGSNGRSVGLARPSHSWRRPSHSWRRSSWSWGLLIGTLYVPCVNATPPDAREVAQAVDQSIAVEVWAPRQDSVSGSSVLTQADDATFLRRLTFDLAGRPPSIEEIRSFQTSQDANKRRVALRRLLQQDTFGQRWGPLLAGRRAFAAHR